MRIGYLDCFAGISGDMLLGALVDAGVSRSLLEETVLALDLGASLRFSSVDRSGITATKVDVIDAAGKAAEHQHHPHPHHHHHHHHHDHDHSPPELPSRPSAGAARAKQATRTLTRGNITTIILTFTGAPGSRSRN
ncbi:nickel insertion protein [Pseudacidobacterium ailaaui]|uniref:nickel insertion protein n=1 Tax=Pseudacidobacterium ailaaui TaxID=1382359 RepID=UPI000A48DCCE|nr:nickel insertion protein [Pseudacidobacterium ailaaui]